MTRIEAEKIVLAATVAERFGEFKVTKDYIEAMILLAPTPKSKSLTLPYRRPKNLAELTALRKEMGWPVPTVVMRNGVPILMMTK
jgi:hypothetical protein